MRIGHDLLATPPRLASGRRVGQDPSSAAQRAEQSRPDRLVPGGGRQCFRAGGGGGEKTGPNPTDRRKKGSKHHVLTDAQGIPLAKSLTAANRHDVTQLLPLADTIPPVKGKRGRPRRRPARLYGDRAYDSRRHRLGLWARGIAPAIAQRNTEHGSGLGIYRWVVERTLSWLHQFRRLRVRYERRADIHEAFLTLGCIVICHNYLTGSLC
jgi:transposase